MGTTAQPRIVHKLLIRTSVLLFALAAVFLGVRWVNDYRENRVDLGPHAETGGMIVAIEDKGEGSQAVIFKPDGSLLECPDYEASKTDREATWQPDGERVFFSSDRRSKDFHIFRWNPENGDVTDKTLVNASQSTPFFASDADQPNHQAIITSRGYVLAFDTLGGPPVQLLPAKSREIGQNEEGGHTSQFEIVYGKYGTSFQTARWLKGRKWIAAVMQAEDGQTLIVQNMEATTPEEATPKAIAAGDKIDIDIDVKNGRLVYAVRNFRALDAKISQDDLVKNPEAAAKKLRPFRNGIGVIDPDNPPGLLVVQTNDDKNAFAQPAVDPSGDRVAFVVGHVDSAGSFVPEGLITCPLILGGGGSATPLVQGDIYEPNWSPAGDQLAFIKRTDGHRAIWTAHADGSDAHNVSGDKGDFAYPKFSPMVKKG